MPRLVLEFLQSNRVPYVTFRHQAAFAAQREAAVSHVPGRSWAKTVVCFADAEPILAVLPANLMVDLEQLRVLAAADAIRLAREQELGDLCPYCEPGAMPPFGNLSFQRVFVDPSLVGEPEMVFCAGTHTDAIRMHYGDFADLTHPRVGVFAVATAGAARRTGPARPPMSLK
ncbi:MAG: YbaK/EbsC family protein [Acidobacteria bacterium]|nr:YbaK/EbsC family protein [Acidobacteriota bacterium]